MARKTYTLCGNGSFERDYGLADQVKRAVISIMANIAEGFSRQSDREFSHFLFIAKSSASELQSHLYVGLDQGYIPTQEFDLLYAQLERIHKQISNLIKYLRSCTTRTPRSPVSDPTTR